MPPRDRQFSRVSDPLGRVLQRIDPEHRLDGYRLWLFWDEVVGELIAKRAQPLRIRNEVLFVTVSSHTWMQELQFLKGSICERLNERLGAPLIKDLAFVSGSVKESRPTADETPTAPVVVPELPPTGLPELDAVLRRVAQACSRRRAVVKVERKRRTRKRVTSDK